MKKAILQNLYAMLFLPLVCSVAMVTLILIGYGVAEWQAMHGGSRAHLDASAVQTLAWLGIFCIGLIPGSRMLGRKEDRKPTEAPDASSGCRSRIWLSKVLAGVVVTYVLAVCMYTVNVALVPPLFGTTTGALYFVLQAFWHKLWWLVLLVILYSYAISLFFATVLDHPITVAALAFVFGYIFANFVRGLLGGSHPYGWQALLPVTISFCFVNFALLSSSYFGYCRRLSVRSARFTAIYTLAVWMVVGAGGWAAFTAAIPVLYRRDNVAIIENVHAETVPGRYWATMHYSVKPAWTGLFSQQTIILAPGDRRVPFVEPDRTRDPNATIKSSIVGTTDMSTRQCPVQVTYIPQKPAGHDHEVIQILARDSRVVGEIDIDAVKMVHTGE